MQRVLYGRLRGVENSGTEVWSPPKSFDCPIGIRFGLI